LRGSAVGHRFSALLHSWGMAVIWGPP